MSKSATLMPTPDPRHMELLGHVYDRMLAAYKDKGRVLGVVTYDTATERFTIGYTPDKHVDVPHVMAKGVPEEVAIEIVKSEKGYNLAEGVPVLVTESGPKGNSYSFVMIGL